MLEAKKEVIQLQMDAAIKAKDAELVEKEMEISKLEGQIEKLKLKLDEANAQVKLAYGEEPTVMD